MINNFRNIERNIESNIIRTMGFLDFDIVKIDINVKIRNNIFSNVNQRLTIIYSFSDLLYWRYKNEEYLKIKENVLNNIKQYIKDGKY